MVVDQCPAEPIGARSLLGVLHGNVRLIVSNVCAHHFQGLKCDFDPIDVIAANTKGHVEGNVLKYHLNVTGHMKTET